MKGAPRSEILHAAIAGLANSGKSSMMNAIFGREVALVSEHAGTTTDPVTKQIELAGAGPVALTDTAGLDDSSLLGPERVRRSMERLADSDILILATRLDRPPSAEEKSLAERFASSGRKIVIAATFADSGLIDREKACWLESRPHALVDNISGRGIRELKELVIEAAAGCDAEASPLEGLVRPGDRLLLVMPQDSGAPRGRLILPQAETIRDALDRGCIVTAARESEAADAYAAFSRRPDLVITDSQAFSVVAAAVAPDQALTSFSILFARKKGDLALFSRGLSALEALRESGSVLIVEACAHHAQKDDIGTVKIPAILRSRLRPDIGISFAKALESGTDYSGHALAIFCGGCMRTRREMLRMTAHLEAQGIAVTNYGIFLAWASGLLPRALPDAPFVRFIS